MEPFTLPRPASRFLPLLGSLLIVFLGLFLVLLSGLLVAGRVPCSPGASMEAGRRHGVDPSRFDLVKVGMPESHVLELLGLPSESKGPQLDPIAVPDVLNPQDCDGKIRCFCDSPVKELFYYRGTAGESFSVYIDSAGIVCCHQHSNVMRMDFSSS